MDIYVQPVSTIHFLFSRRDHDRYLKIDRDCKGFILERIYSRSSDAWLQRGYNNLQSRYVHLGTQISPIKCSQTIKLELWKHEQVLFNIIKFAWNDCCRWSS